MLFSTSAARRRLILLPLCLAFAACGGSQGDPAPSPSVELRVVSGGNQSGSAGAALPQPIVVQVVESQSGAAQVGVHLRPSLNSGGNVLPTDATTDQAGQAVFTWTLASSPGAQQMLISGVDINVQTTVTATAQGVAPVATVTVDPGTAGLGLGQVQQFTATLRDVAGNALTGRTVTWSSSNSGIVSVGASSGLATGVAAGTATITAISESRTGFALVTVSSVIASQLAIATQPSGASNAVPFTTQPVVEIRDASGVRAPNSSAQVTATIQDGTGALGGTTTVNAVNGIATFTNLSIVGANAYTLRFTSPGLTPVTSASFAIALVPVSLHVVTQPGGAASGVAFTTQPVVEVLDQTGAAFTGSTIQITAADPGSGVLSGTLTISTVNGLATFTDLSITGSGTHSLGFSAPGVSGVSSQSFVVSTGGGGGGGGTQVATSLAIATQPGGSVTGANLATQPVINVFDASGVVVSASTALVTASVASGNGVLSGTTTVSATSGVATFTNLRISGTGAQTLRFTSPGLTDVVSASFTVAAAPSGIVLDVGVATPASVQAGQNITIPVVLDMTNAGGGNAASTSFTINWDVTKFTFVSGTVNGSSTLILNANTNNAASNGTVQVSGFNSTGATTTQTLFTLVLTAKASAANSGTSVTASVGASGDQNGNAFTITPRNLTVNITP